MLTFKQSPHYGTGVQVYDEAGDLVLDASVRPIRVKKDADLTALTDNYPGELAVYDGEGVKVVWTEDGQTFTDDSGDLEVFE